MLRDVLRKTVHDHRRALFFWLLGLLGLIGMQVGLWPSVRAQAKDLNELLKTYPDTVKAFLGIDESTSYATPVGYLQTELFGLMIPLLMLVFSIGQGAKATAGEERDGTLDLLLAAPISRRRILTEKFAASALMLTGLGGAVFGSLALLTRFAGLDVGLVPLAQAVTGTLLLGAGFGAFALFLGALTGSRGTAIGVASAMAVLTFFVDSLGRLVAGLAPFRPLSPFSLYGRGGPLVAGLQADHVLGLVGIVVVFFGLALFAFDRREVAV